MKKKIESNWNFQLVSANFWFRAEWKKVTSRAEPSYGSSQLGSDSSLADMYVEFSRSVGFVEVHNTYFYHIKSSGQDENAIKDFPISCISAALLSFPMVDSKSNLEISK